MITEDTEMRNSSGSEIQRCCIQAKAASLTVHCYVKSLAQAFLIRLGEFADLSVYVFSRLRPPFATRQLGVGQHKRTKAQTSQC